VHRHGLTKSEESITNDPDYCFAKILSEQRIDIESKLIKEENSTDESKVDVKPVENADGVKQVEQEKVEGAEDGEEAGATENGVKEPTKNEGDEQNDGEIVTQKEKELTIERIMAGPSIAIVTAWPKVGINETHSDADVY
jgi:hypothetical protein